jgi:lysophospholipase L1-like esterase
VVAACVLAGCGGDDDDAASRAPEPVRWLSLGDSFASAEGLRGARGRCARSDHAFSPRAAALVAADVDVAQVVHVACSGAEIDEVEAQIAQAEPELPEGEHFNLVTVTIGGNDAGFGFVLLDCIGTDELAHDAVRALLGREPRGCDIDDTELDRRARELKPRLEQFYRRLAELVGPDGNVIVLDYPHLFEAPDTWTAGTGARCDGFDRTDAQFLRSAGDELNDTIGAATAVSDRVHFLDIAPLFDGHGRCGADPWLFGVTFGVRQGTFRVQASFHPTDDGHAAMADAIVERVRELYAK